MRMRKSIWAALAAGSLATAAFAQVQVTTGSDGNPLNGQMVNDKPIWSQNVGGLPHFWNAFDTTGGAGIVVHTMGGGDANQIYNLLWEDSDGIPGAFDAYDYAASNGFGHGLRFGGSAGAGEYGVARTFNTTPGKVYFMSGTYNSNNSMRGTASNPTAWMNWGLENGSSWTADGGVATNGGSNGLGSQQRLANRTFHHGIVATASQMTARFGVRAVGGAAGGGTNLVVDGIRVWEFDPVVNTSLQNGDFEGPKFNASLWRTENPTHAATTYNEFILPTGWIPLGAGGGQVDKFNTSTAGAPAGATPVTGFQMDSFGGLGRSYLLQRVDLGGAGLLYTLSADVFSFNGATGANAMIGIDRAGGLDPNAGTVVWSSVNPADGAWRNLLVSATSLTDAGITVFLASGSDTLHGASAGSKFDNVVLVPEPATLLALGVGAVAFLRRRRA